MTLAARAAHRAFPERPHNQQTELRPIDRRSLAGDAPAVAQWLLGHLLVRDDADGRTLARIVETEAYAGPEDRASHARAGRTARTSVMFGPPGRAYVYLVYGMHHCLNVVCGADGQASAVLIRAVEPLAGIEHMRDRRRREGESDDRLAAGPARLCQALDIDRSLDGVDLLERDRLWLAGGPTSSIDPGRIVRGQRIGVSYAGEDWAGRPWRFGVGDSPSLSRLFPVAG